MEIACTDRSRVILKLPTPLPCFVGGRDGPKPQRTRTVLPLRMIPQLISLQQKATEQNRPVFTNSDFRSGVPPEVILHGAGRPSSQEDRSALTIGFPGQP